MAVFGCLSQGSSFSPEENLPHFLSGCSSSTSCLVFHFLSGPVLHFQGGGGNPFTWGIDSLSNPGAFDGGLIPVSCSSCPENKPLIFQQQKSEERCFILSFSVCRVLSVIFPRLGAPASCLLLFLH